VCNCRDDNCNGVVDDNPMGEGETCRTFAAGLQVTPPSTCREGHKHCEESTCDFACVNEIGPSPEICDGLDNDCDGVVDNQAPCPPSFTCLQGQCQPNCHVGEFPCTAGRRCIDVTTGNDCSPARADCVCESNLCQTAGCDPATQDCFIMNNAATCRDRCPPDRCTAPQTCDPATGRCVDCHTLGCDPGQVCVGSPGQCQPDPCANVTCNPGDCAGWL
jgi:hypothetical protein